MRRLSLLTLAMLAAPVARAVAQTPPTGAPPQQGAAAPAGRGGQRGGRGGVQVMTLSTTGWDDGGVIPPKYSQASEEMSPPLTWSEPPAGVASFVLVVHDANTGAGNGLDDVVHWLVWNIPGSAKGLPEGVSQGPQLPDGTRQISATGPYYRGPAAVASGPPHHYVFELYALDAQLDIQPVGATPAATRTAVMGAMVGHVRGKAVMVGLYKRPG
jgi:hypothetical protein